MKKLEAFMIIRNEEEMLGAALDSIEGIDMVTICDTGCSDGTFDVYKEYQEKGYNLKWFKYSRFDTENHIKHFSHARNECKQHCTGEWLLYIDGDEVNEFEVQKVKNMINSQWIKPYTVLLVDVQTDIDLTHQPRVIRNNPDLWYHGAAHNSLRRFPDGIDGKSEQLSTSEYYKTSLRLRAYTSPSHQKEPNRTLNILLEELKTDPYNDRYIYYIVREWLNRREPIKALFYLERYFKIAPPTNELAVAYFLAATCYADMGEHMKACEYALKSVAVLPSLRVSWKLLEALSHPQWKEYWHHMVVYADNKGVLFIRDEK